MDRRTRPHERQRQRRSESPGDDRQRPWAVHRLQPGRLIVGLTALVLSLMFGGDAAGFWTTPGWAVFPVGGTGLVVAGSVSGAVYSVRRRRSAISASTESTEAPARISGSQAIR
ncbi:hypothetical protein [Streptomyces yaizuensis]|uniref:Integral membrane protein n=1 Tax=Streptomyces yaizuensis TaxID=2989713 RepID=A0ABQ5P4Y5_9ACTN|nr:hypothetical protein [Streptomyces sp. YSPA8]GLF97647.1 hypothetical protein SYYSPA8_25140 [Streptomyces sp. YSPA8]